MTEMKKILVTGACGQIGSELTGELRKKYGSENVIAADLKDTPPPALQGTGPYHKFDVTQISTIEEIINEYNIDSVFHMAAILSAVGEQNPQLCWNVNMCGTQNMLDLGIKYKFKRIIVPSSIAVWGPGVPLKNTPQETVLKPTTMYGVTKVAGELLCDYYVQRFGLDIRGLRYPGIISSETLPGGGTTDYAVAIYYEAVEKKEYTCFVKEDTRLPMMYMPDCIKATMDLAEADFNQLKHHADFNVGSMSFDVAELAASIQKIIPEFKINYQPDHRQKIADSWPDSVDDTCARKEWGWNPTWTLDGMTEDMLTKLTLRHQHGKLYL